MRTVFSNAETLHIWAQFPRREQSHGRNSTRSLWFEDRGQSIDTPDGARSDLFSYSTRIASMGQREGELYALVTTRSYSITTTTKHMPSTEFTPETIVFRVDDIGAADSPLVDGMTNHAGNVEDYARRIRASLMSAKRARVHKVFHWEDARRTEQEARRYVEFFKLGDDARALIPEVPDMGEDLKKAVAEWENKERERKAAQREEDREKLESWRKGFGACPHSFKQAQDKKGGAKLRIRERIEPDGKHSRSYTVETSEGASCPIRDAIGALKLAKSARRNRSEIVPDAPISLGSYRLDRVTKDGDIRAGCHIIRWAEIDRIAPELCALWSERPRAASEIEPK